MSLINRHHVRNYIGREYYYNLVLQQLKFLIPEGSSVLDIGCGTGNILAQLKPKRGVGIDFDPRNIEIARNSFLDLEFHQTNVESLKLNEKFDYIILLNSIGYLKDIQSVFECLKRNCHRNTRVIIFHYSFLWTPFLRFAELLHLKKKEKIQNWVSQEDVINFLEVGGYDVILHSEKILFPLWFPLISYLGNKYIANLPGIKSLDLMHVSVARVSVEIPPQERTCSIIIPARNEEGNIEAAVKRTPNLGKNTELIFVEGNSTDNTWNEIKRVAEKYGGRRTIRYAKQSGKGKGDAVRKGFALAKNNILIILDADLTVEPEEIEQFYNLIVSGKGEFINGSRLVYPLAEKAMKPLNLIGNKCFSLIFTFLLNQRFKDTLCGTKVLTKKNYERIAANRSYFGNFDPFGDFDLIFGAAKLSLKIVELPIHYQQRTYGTTNINRWRHGQLLLRMCVFAMRKIKFI